MFLWLFVTAIGCYHIQNERKNTEKSALGLEEGRKALHKYTPFTILR